MVIMSGTATVLQQFVSGLKSRNEDTRAKSAKDLQHYVTTELREVRENNNMLTFNQHNSLVLNLTQVQQWHAVYLIFVSFCDVQLCFSATAKPGWSHYILWRVKPPHIWAGVQFWCEREERRHSRYRYKHQPWAICLSPRSICSEIHGYWFFIPVSLIGVEGGNATRISRFANYLRNLLPSSDPVVMEMASKAMGHLSMAGDTFTAEYVEFEVKRALEWLGADRNEGRRHAAVS